MVVVVASLGLFGWLLVRYPGTEGPGKGVEHRLVLGGDAKLDTVIDELASAGVLEHPRWFAIYARLRGADEALRRGPVTVDDGLTPLELLRRIARGYGPSRVRIPIPEGFTRFDIAARLAHYGICEAEEFERQTGDPGFAAQLDVPAPTLEGYLFPATYDLAIESDAREVARTMVDTFRQRTFPLRAAHEARLEELADRFGWGFHEVLTLASIIEKEAAVAEERPVIAGVFLNRLRDPDFRPKRLQADPTVGYGCLATPQRAASCAGFDGSITRRMTGDADNPYNTYRLEGLPPGPIANPGMSSIAAVLEPARHPFFYFVAKGGGRHHFSASLDEHTDAVARYRGQRP